MEEYHRRWLLRRQGRGGKGTAAARREQRATTIFSSVVTPTRERRVVEVELCIDIDTILEMAESQDDIGEAL